MICLTHEKRLLQTAVALACVVPLIAGTSGMLQGADMLGGGGIDLDSHLRYLSGLLLGIGLGFAACIPAIERHGPRVWLLTAIVVLGGLGRLLGILIEGVPSPIMLGGLAMELGVTPLLCLWQYRLAARYTKATP